MKSYKTEILSFDDALNNHKKVLTESLVNFHEGHRVRKILLDVDSNSADYEYYFQCGQQYKQDEVDELQKNFNNALKTIEIQQRFLDDADGANKIITSQLDELQKRIDEINNHLEINYDENRDDNSHSYWSGYNQALRELFEIIKGEETK